LRIAPELAWQVVDGEGVVVDLPRRCMLGLSPSASFIWSRIETATEDEIAAELARAFDVDEARAQADVRGFLALLRERGFVVAS
jgi:Coenzyme PQQ synthesis protein D (PqqD)